MQKVKRKDKKQVMKRTFQEYAMHATEELHALTSAITKISAPSHHEKWRAVFCARWLIDHGARNVNIDRSGNLIWKFRGLFVPLSASGRRFAVTVRRC